METEIYVTETMTFVKVVEFEEWFDKYIGTEIELEEFGDNEWGATCFDLTMNDVIKCRKWEERNND